MRKIKLSIPLLLFTLIVGLCGCAKNYNYIILPDDICGSEQEGDSAKSRNKVNFVGTIENIIDVRSMTALAADRYASIYAFPTGNFGTLNGLGVYKTESVGVFTPIGGPMYLMSGIYDFYSFGTNKKLGGEYLPGSFVTEYPLNNGIDYIWTKVLKQDIHNPVNTVPLVYNHLCSQVVIKIVAGKDIYLGEISGVSITPSTPGNNVNMQTGVIPPATKILNTKTSMTLNANIAQTIMVPLQTTDSLELNIIAEVNKVGNIVNFTCKVPVYNNEFKSGYSYLYEAIINEDQASFSKVNLINWIDVDNSGKPIYPQ